MHPSNKDYIHLLQVSELGAPSPYSTAQDINASKEYLRGLHAKVLENDKSMDIDEFMGLGSTIKGSGIMSPQLSDHHQQAVTQVDKELETRIQKISSMTLAQENQRLQFEKEQSERAYLEALRLEQEKATALRLEIIKQEKLAAEKERLEAIRAEQQKAEAARELAIQQERERIEQIYQQQLLTEQKRAEEMRLEAIRVERERAEVLRQQAINEEREKAEELRNELRKQEFEKAEKVRLAAERVEREREELERLEREASSMAQQLQKETSSRLKSLTASSTGRDKERRRSIQQTKAELEASSLAAIKEREEQLMLEKAAEEERRRLALMETERVAKEKERLEAQALLEAERLLALKRGVQARLKKKELQLQESLKTKVQDRAISSQHPTDGKEDVSLLAQTQEALPEAHALCETHGVTRKGPVRRVLLVVIMVVAALWTYTLLSLEMQQRSTRFIAPNESLERFFIPDPPVEFLREELVDIIPSPIVDDVAPISDGDATDSMDNTAEPTIIDDGVNQHKLNNNPRWSFRRVVIQVVKLPLVIVKHSIIFAFGLA